MSFGVGRGSFGNFWSISPEEIVDKIASVNGKNIEMWCGDGRLDYNAMYQMPVGYSMVGGPITVEEYLQRTRARATEKGIKLGFQYGLGPKEETINGAIYHSQIDVVNNVNGYGDTYIAICKQIIQNFQPDFMDVLNEPIGNLFPTDFYPTAEYLQTFNAFMLRCIDEFRSVKPNLVLVAQGCPWTDLAQYIGNPIPRSNLLYAYHDYYPSWENVEPSHYDYESYWNWRYEYWIGDFVNGKRHLYEYLTTLRRIVDAVNSGLTVWFEEAGGNCSSPNCEIAMKDYWDFAVLHGIDFNVQMNDDVWSNYPSQWDSAGILKPEGEVWVTYLSPFMFAGKNWTVHKGNWSVT